MKAKLRLLPILFFSTIWLLAACKPLVGTEWTLISLNGNELIEGTVITLRFNNSWMAGFAGCNRYSVNMEIKDDTNIFNDDDAAVTDALCLSPEGIMSQEKEYVTTLTSVVTYSRSDNRLELLNEKGDVVLIFKKGRPKDFPG